MDPARIRFRITRLEVEVADGVPIEWQGREFSSGRLTIALDEEAGPGANQGLLDYSRGQAQAEFHVLLAFPEFAAMLEGLGVEPAMSQPVRAVLRSEGEILPDHSFFLAGRCELRPHAVFAPGRAAAEVLPGH